MTDYSNMGRCDICGKPIDLEHSGDRLATNNWTGLTPEDAAVSPEMVRDSILGQLDHSDNTNDDMLAQALRTDGEFVTHLRCYEQTSLAVDPDNLPDDQ